MKQHFNHETNHVDGFHPIYPHLAYYEAEPHYGSYIITSPAKEGSILMNEGDAKYMFEDRLDNRYGYFTDEYLQFMEVVE